MQIKQQITIDTPADKVWEILGNNFDRVADWASGVYVSQANTSDRVIPNATYSGRVWETVIGRFDETITRYDEREKIVSYTAQGDKMPFFVKGLSNSWMVQSLGNSNKGNVYVG